MIKIIINERNRITVNQNDLCILDLKICEYKLKENDKIEIIMNGNKTIQDYNNTDIIFPTDIKGIFDYSITIIQNEIARTKVIENKYEVI